MRGPGLFVDKVKKALWILKDKRIAVLGLAFKPETDDIREASSIKIIRELVKEGSGLRLYDPKAMDNMKEVFPPSPQVAYCEDPYQAAAGRERPPRRHRMGGIPNARPGPAQGPHGQSDHRRRPEYVRPGSVRKLGFEYYSVGRK